jgi:hypothetical protein
MQCKNCFSHYSGSYCKICGTPPEKKSKKPIAKRSKKRAKEEAEYSKVRLAYLKIFPVCEVLNCGNKSTEIHHRQGRIGALLTDVNHFLAVCEPCHKYIEMHPAWSKEQGYSESRLN